MFHSIFTFCTLSVFCWFNIGEYLHDDFLFFFHQRDAHYSTLIWMNKSLFRISLNAFTIFKAKNDHSQPFVSIFLDSTNDQIEDKLQSIAIGLFSRVFTHNNLLNLLDVDHFYIIFCGLDSLFTFILFAIPAPILVTSDIVFGLNERQILILQFSSDGVLFFFFSGVFVCIYET